MDIYYSISDCAFEVNSLEELRESLIDYFTVDGISAEVTIEGDFVKVHFYEESVKQAQNEITTIADLCNTGNFAAAENKLDKFLKKHPRHSEAYRIKAQLLSDRNQYDEAIDVNIEALRCNPRNVWALLLMGNIYGKNKSDFETAQKYYDKILEYHPNNSIAINNIAALLMEKNKFSKAIPMFEKVLKMDPKYANAYYGLAVCYYNMNDKQNCFDIALKGSVKAERKTENPHTLDELHKIMVSAAHDIVDNYNFENVFLGIKELIESEEK